MTDVKRIPLSEAVEYLTKLRKDGGLSMREVARRMGTNQSTVHQVESQTRDIRVSTLQRYARAIGHPIVAFDVIPDDEGEQ